MALFYDRDYGRGRSRYDRGYRGQAWGGFEGAFDEPNPSRRNRYADSYDPFFSSGRPGGQYSSTGRPGGQYGRDYMPRGNRYGSGYRRQWQTDQGDPFGDRSSHTPIRMTEGSFRDQERQGTSGWDMDYDRDYSANPVGYDPYYDQSRQSRQGYGRTRYDRDIRRGRARGYDTGWW